MSAASNTAPDTSTALRIGTRASALALWQAHHVQALIRALPGAPDIVLEHIRTEGDERTDVPLWALRGRAFFTKEIDRALLEERVDLAVHSLKDLSTVLEPGLGLHATLTREDPRDALLSANGATLDTLPRGARVGTSSLRRRAFLNALRPDLELVELRGNVPTRIERLRKGDYAAIVLAAAGVKRLGLDSHVTEYLDEARFPPAVSQGAIGVCARSADAGTQRWLAPLDDAPTRLATTAERALLRRLEGGCQVPLGAGARWHGNRLSLAAAVCALDGSRQLRGEGVHEFAAAPVADSAALAAASVLGIAVADQLLAQGADRLIAAERERAGAVS